MNPGTQNSLSAGARERLGQLLNHALADEFALSAVTRDYHWNVKGPHFRSLHETFDEQYHQIDDWVERIGERARALGITPRAGWRELVRARRIRPPSGAGLSANEMIAGLAALHYCVAERLRTDVTEARQQGDAATGRLFDDLIEYHDTTSWMLGELKEERELAQA